MSDAMIQPDAPGWYWYRKDDDYAWSVMEVVLLDTRVLMCRYVMDEGSNPKHYRGEWIRIHEPEEQRDDDYEVRIGQGEFGGHDGMTTNNDVVQFVETSTPDGKEMVLQYRCRQFEMDASMSLCGLGTWGPWRVVEFVPLGADRQPNVNSDLIQKQERRDGD